MELFHGLFVRNSFGSILKSLFDARAKPLMVARLGLANFALPRGKVLIRHDPFLADEIFDEPITLTEGELPDLVEDSLRVRIHGKIVSLNANRPPVYCSIMIAIEMIAYPM